jgi:CubicO group peptidase (beta-lactamase class C family)
VEQGLRDRVFPGAVLLVSKNNTVLFLKAYGYANIFSRQQMTIETIFDLASLTKPLATTLSVMKLVQDGELDFAQKVASVLSQFNDSQKGSMTIKHLLAHQSGFPDHRPYYFKLDKVPSGKRQQMLRQLLIKEPLLSSPGERFVYSDLGFMVLQWLVESISKQRLSTYVAEQVYPLYGIAPSKSAGLHFRGVGNTCSKREFAATERCPWRNTLLDGVVHDENAYVMGGVGGHAGLFGTATDVHDLVSANISDYYGLSKRPVFEKYFMETCFGQGGHFDRPLGFDIPTLPQPSCGSYFSSNSVGHLGFTGTSFWIDLDRAITVIFLTNRIHPSRANGKIKAFRPQLHDGVMESLKAVSKPLSAPIKNG